MNNVQHVGSCSNKIISLEFSWYITGFVDGEGCFSLSFTQRSKMKMGIEVRPSFMIGQNKNSLELLQEIAEYFGCGSIRFSKFDQLYKYEVRSLDEIRKKIIPHFKKYPLKTSKQDDFDKFVEICDDIAACLHLNEEGLENIINKAYSMNKSGKRKYTHEQLLQMIRTR